MLTFATEIFGRDDVLPRVWMRPMPYSISCILVDIL